MRLTIEFCSSADCFVVYFSQITFIRLDPSFHCNLMITEDFIFQIAFQNEGPFLKQIL